MAVSDWIAIRGQEFTREEARTASDFQTTILNFGLKLDSAYALFKTQPGLSTGCLLVIAEKFSIYDVAELLIMTDDVRILEIIKSRLDEAKKAEHV